MLETVDVSVEKQMTKPDFSPEMRALQDQFETRKLADMVVKHVFHNELSEKDQTFIQEARFFFLATTDANGQPQPDQQVQRVAQFTSDIVQRLGSSLLIYDYRRSKRPCLCINS